MVAVIVLTRSHRPNLVHGSVSMVGYDLIVDTFKTLAILSAIPFRDPQLPDSEQIRTGRLDL